MTQHPGVLTVDGPLDARESFRIIKGLNVPAVGEAAPEGAALVAPTHPGGGEGMLSGRGRALQTQPTDLKARVRAALLAGAGLLAIASSGYVAWHYWTVGRFNVSTDNAYVKADNITIAPKVSGYIGSVLVGDNQGVHSGQVLARIDDRDFKVALQQADAGVAAARAARATKRAALAAQQSRIEAARATIAADEADATFAGQEEKRYLELASTGSGSVQNAQKAQSRYAAARAAIARDTAALTNAVTQLDVLKAELAQAEAALAHSESVRSQAELNLSYTSITAPANAVVGNRTLRVGQYVLAGTQLMALVPVDAAYVVANYKETQLTHVRPGQPVAISVDMYPGHRFRGRIDSLAPASGQEFALLPPDNATGNFTKVVQRIPVKIVLDAPQSQADVLRPGMSVITTIDTKAAEQSPATTLASKH
jgi:membrane fusion protein (multidrug efflux system)